MRAGENFEYLFEVDGEHRYDFDCEFSNVEVRDTTTTTTTTTTSTIIVGQNIIANSIQIEDKVDSALNSSTCSSSHSSIDLNNNVEGNLNNDVEDWQMSGPVVSWPASVEKLVKQLKPKQDVMVMPMMSSAAASAAANPAQFTQYISNNCEASFNSMQESFDYYSYCGTPYYPQPEQKEMPGSFSVKAVKRVHFWDVAHQQHLQQQQQAAF